MGLKLIITIILLLLLTVIEAGYASWSGPFEVLSGTWGSSPGQFGIKYGDTNDVFAGPIYIMADGKIVIQDVINGRYKVYGTDGALKKALKCIEISRDVYNEECNFDGDYLQVMSDGNIWVDQSNYKQIKYSLYSPTGQLIKTSTTRPLELGVVERDSAISGGYLQRIKYPDKTFSFVIPWRTLNSFQQDNSGNLIVTAQTDTKDSVYKISVCGKILGQMQMPEDKGHIVQQVGPEAIGALDYEYGKPVIAPNGDIYTWKRTPDAYSILKWTWVNDPDTPRCPEEKTTSR